MRRHRLINPLRLVRLAKWLFFVCRLCVKPDFRRMLRSDKQVRKVFLTDPISRHLYHFSPPLYRLRYAAADRVWQVRSLATLTLRWLQRRECFVVESGTCCDTGRFSSESRFTNPVRAFKRLLYLNREDWSDGPSGGYIGDGTMWREDYTYSQAPYGWDALAADREHEEDERYARSLGYELL
jgi:hypothetical protein